MSDRPTEAREVARRLASWAGIADPDRLCLYQPAPPLVYGQMMMIFPREDGLVPAWHAFLGRAFEALEAVDAAREYLAAQDAA